MESDSQKMFFAALILTIAIPMSTSLLEISRRLENVCSETKRSDECRNILKSELNRFNDDSDERTIVEGVADLAIAKSKEIYDRIWQYYLDSKDDDRLKMKYFSCAKNYYNANCNLVLAQRNLDFDEFPNISYEVDDAEEQLKNCRREFGEESLVPGRVEGPNEELGLYLDMVRAAAGRLPNDDKGELEALPI